VVALRATRLILASCAVVALEKLDPYSSSGGGCDGRFQDTGIDVADSRSPSLAAAVRQPAHGSAKVDVVYDFLKDPLARRRPSSVHSDRAGRPRLAGLLRRVTAPTNHSMPDRSVAFLRKRAASGNRQPADAIARVAVQDCEDRSGTNALGGGS
jgi:hypothetical protein